MSVVALLLQLEENFPKTEKNRQLQRLAAGYLLKPTHAWLHFSTAAMWEGLGDRFEVGDFVFAKLKGHPHWPATISQIETLYANSAPGQERTRYNVYFYGSHQMSMIKVDSIVSFHDHYELFKRKYALNSKFCLALKELEADKATREDYVKSLQIVDSIRPEDPQDKPDDEMFSCLDDSPDEAISHSDRHSYRSANSSGYGESFDSDEEYRTLQNQRYEILSMEKIHYVGSSDTLLVISLGFNDKDLQKDYQDIREEIRMQTCYVVLERCNHLIRKSRGRPRKRERGPYKKRIYVEETVPVPSPQKHFREEKREGRKWKATKWTNKPSLTVLAAEAVKRRRRQRKVNHRDESRLLSLRQRNPDAALAENAREGTSSCSCLLENCDCLKAQQPLVIICPICQAQFSSSIDFKQHSFNIHIMGL